MKMNFKNAIMAAALITGFASCSNDDVIDNGTGIVANGEPTLAKISISQIAGPGTRATEEATTAEKTLNTVTVYIFDAGQRYVDKADIVVNAGIPQAKTVKLSTGSHYFYAVANGAAQSFAPGVTTMDQAEKTIINVSSMDDLITPNYLMTNVERPVAVNLQKATEEEAAAKNPINIKIGRAMAKVNVALSSTVQQPELGELTDVEYMVINNPKEMYLFPVYENQKLISPFASADPVVSNNYFPDLTGALTGFKTADGDEANSLYAVENANVTPKQGNTTTALIRGKFVPAKWYGSDGVEKTSPVGDTFYRIYSPTKDAYSDKFYDETPVQSEVDAFNTAMSVSDSKVLIYTDGICYYGLPLADNSQTDLAKRFAMVRNNYYKVSITSVSAAGRSSAGGDNDEPGVTPKPNENIGADAWISATITVLPWNVINQEGGI